MDVICRAGYHRMRLVKIFGHSEYVGRESAFDSVSDDENARIESSNVAVRVEDEILTHSQTIFLIRHNVLFGLHALVQSCRQVISTICGSDDILHPNTDVNVEPNVDASTVTDGDIDTDIDTVINPILMPKSMSMYSDDTRWEPKITPYSSMEEGDGNKDENKANDGDEDEDDGGDEDKHEGRGENEEDKDDSHDQVKEPHRYGRRKIFKRTAVVAMQ
ncbi:hypothetical protein Goklo_024031 [Gossypium klotzschianum]|uniref:Uncharacterized protein n=1 Tax=Gossypium klotzschianum TaxID=34286 RepID=A0A7J8W9R0_9ROSI|nr:hypothetical protein [Gossypium klotzschianum]